MKWWVCLYLLMLPLIPWASELAVSNGSPWWTHFTYMWAHAGWLHYLLNGLCWVMMWKLLTPARTVTAVLIAAALPSCGTPVVGWSVVLYYYMGLCLAYMPAAARIRLLLVVGIGFCLPWMAAWHHACMLTAGWLIRKVEVKWLATVR